MDVGVRELKERLSHYLDLVEKGEVVRVTERGVPKALLTPIISSGQLERGVAEGWVRPPKRVGLAPSRPAHGVRAIRDVLDDDRSDER